MRFGRDGLRGRARWFAQTLLRGLALGLLACGSMVAARGAAQSQEFASPWSKGMKSAMRLLAAGGERTRSYRAGVEIRMDGAAITYWRAPGESGAAPVLDYQGSDNVRSVRMEFPAPRKLDEEGEQAFGYTEDVVFPLEVIAEDPAKPVALRVKLDYAVCERICIPVRAHAQIALPPGEEPGPFVSILAEFAAKVPAPQTVGAAAPLTVTGVRDVDPKAGTFTVVGRAPAGTAIELFPEAPDGWYLMAGAASVRPDGAFSVPVSAAQVPKDGNLAKTPFRFTVVGGDRAIDVTMRLDGQPPTP
jgi:DsbC/DsbD-like thiol-disulfide interchange protein